MKSFAARVAVLFLLGAVVVSFFDGFHTYSATTRYPSPVLWRMAWWTPLLFGSAVSGLGVAYVACRRAMGVRTPPPPWPRLAVGFVVFAALYFASGYLPASNAIKLAVLVGGAGAIWAANDRTWQGAALGVGTAIAGVGTEIVLTSLGAFEHLQPDWLGVPAWLPGLYMAAAPSVGLVAVRVLGAEAGAPAARDDGEPSVGGLLAG